MYKFNFGSAAVLREAVNRFFNNFFFMAGDSRALFMQRQVIRVDSFPHRNSQEGYRFSFPFPNKR